jgi:hypothetical protein
MFILNLNFKFTQSILTGFFLNLRAHIKDDRLTVPHLNLRTHLNLRAQCLFGYHHQN